MGQRYSEQQWRDWLDEFERSDLTVARFCQSIGVCVQTFYRWRRKLANGDASGLDAAVILGQSPFVSIACPMPVVEFEFPNQVIARVPNDSALLRPLVRALMDEGTSS